MRILLLLLALALSGIVGFFLGAAPLDVDRLVIDVQPEDECRRVDG